MNTNIRDAMAEVTMEVLKEREVVNEVLMSGVNLGDETILDNIDGAAVAEYVTDIIRDYVHDHIKEAIASVLLNMDFYRVPDCIWEEPVGKYVEGWLDKYGADLLADVCCNYVQDLMEDGTLYEEIIDLNDLAGQIVEEAL